MTAGSTVIEDDVMFAANVIVMDALHGFENASVPYKYQPMWRAAPVRIGKGCWIAQNVVVMPGVSIGELSTEQRAVVDLTYFHEFGYREIAELMDCPVDTVKTRMFHARRRLKIKLAGQLADWL